MKKKKIDPDLTLKKTQNSPAVATGAVTALAATTTLAVGPAGACEGTVVM